MFDAGTGFGQYAYYCFRRFRMDADEAKQRVEIFRSLRTGWLLEATPELRRRWHNQKYFTWVEQQGRSVEELRAQEDPAFWVGEQERAREVDRRIRERRA